MQSSSRFSEEKIVIEIGSVSSKAGFSQESAPRIISLHKSHNERIAPLEIYSMSAEKIVNQKEIEDQLYELFETIFFRQLLVEPKQRKVIICENILYPIAFKKLIATILFEKYQVASVAFLSSHLLAFLTTPPSATRQLQELKTEDKEKKNILSGLVIDCGFYETSIIPISENRTLISYSQSIPLAGEAINKQLFEFIKEHGVLLKSDGTSTKMSELEDSNLSQLLDFQVLEQTKVRLLSISNSPTIIPETAEKMVINIENNQRIEIPTWIKTATTDILFKEDEDDRSIPISVLECLLRCGQDLRTPMAENIILTGGTSMIKGFSSRLLLSLQKLLVNEPRYASLQGLESRLKITSTPFQLNLLSWIGGSLVGSIKSNIQEMTLEEFLQKKDVPDWSHERL